MKKLQITAWEFEAGDDVPEWLIERKVEPSGKKGEHTFCAKGYILALDDYFYVVRHIDDRSEWITKVSGSTKGVTLSANDRDVFLVEDISWQQLALSADRGGKRFEGTSDLHFGDTKGASQ